MNRTLLSLLALSLASCTFTGQGGGASSASDLKQDVGEEDLGPLRDLAGCKASPQTLTCRALVAFGSGTLPSTPAGLVSRAGAVSLIPAPGTPEAGQPPALGASYLLLVEGSARFQILIPSDARENDAAQDLVDIIGAGRPLPADNMVVRYARSRSDKGDRKVSPTKPVGRSLAWTSGESVVYLRETSLGLVAVERNPALLMVGVFPADPGSSGASTRAPDALLDGERGRASARAEINRAPGL